LIVGYFIEYQKSNLPKYVWSTKLYCGQCRHGRYHRAKKTPHKPSGMLLGICMHILLIENIVFHNRILCTHKPSHHYPLLIISHTPSQAYNHYSSSLLSIIKPALTLCRAGLATGTSSSSSESMPSLLPLLKAG